MAKVLLADDEEALRLMMGRQLRRAGHEVTLAEDGLAAVALLERDRFDVVVSDMKMPRLDGIGLLARGKELAPDTEFVILTGHGSMENAVEAFKTGNVFDYLLKPLDDIRELDAVVSRAIERRHLRSENTRLVGELELRIEELEAAKSELTHLAARDGLTGLLNHRAINAHLDSTLETNPEASASVILLDMDGFKKFNDTYGHLVGDQVLRHIAATLETRCPTHAAIGRSGGDEFMIVLPGMDAREARELGAGIRAEMGERPFRNPDGVALPIVLCVGISDTETAGRSAVAMLAAADAALYENKQRSSDGGHLHVEASESVDSGSRTTFGVLDGLVTAIDRKDRYTRRHSEDVTNYALMLAQTLNLSGETYNALRLAGLLHDVGKIGVPDSVLSKPGRLTEEEYDVMKSHVVISALIIHGLPRLADILDAVANHHERWDGKGYPNGLAGEQIPLLGRIMAIADAFSAMTLDRPYRVGMSFDAGLSEIEKGSGSQFDPTLAPLFVATVRTSSAQPADDKLAA